MNFEIIILNERKQHLTFHVYEISRIGNFTDTDGISVSLRLEEGDNEECLLIGRGFTLGLIKMF